MSLRYLENLADRMTAAPATIVIRDLHQTPTRFLLGEFQGDHFNSARSTRGYGSAGQGPRKPDRLLRQHERMSKDLPHRPVWNTTEGRPESGNNRHHPRRRCSQAMLISLRFFPKTLLSRACALHILYGKGRKSSKTCAIEKNSAPMRAVSGAGAGRDINEAWPYMCARTSSTMIVLRAPHRKTVARSERSSPICPSRGTQSSPIPEARPSLHADPQPNDGTLYRQIVTPDSRSRRCAPHRHAAHSAPTGSSSVRCAARRP